MNDEVKEILIDLVEYYNAMGTKNDPGIQTFESVAIRASHVLKRIASEGTQCSKLRSSDIDPYAMDVVGSPKQLPLKFENEW